MSSSSRRIVRTATTDHGPDSGTKGSWSCRMHRFPHGRLSGCGVSAGSACQSLLHGGSDADEYSSCHPNEALSAAQSLWRRSEALIGSGHPKLERVSKIDPASSAFFRESGHERGDRLEIADSREVGREVRSVEALRHRFGHAPPRIEGAREHLLDPCLGEHLRDSVRGPTAGRRIRRSETDECRETGVGEGAKAAEPRVDRWRPGFQQRPGAVIECWDGHADLDLGELREEVEVPNHERSSREDGHRPAGLQEHFERVAGDSILPLDELVRIRRGRDRNEALGKAPHFLREDGRRIALHDHGGSPRAPVNPEEPRRIAEGAPVIASVVRVDGIVNARQRIAPQSRRNVEFADLERFTWGWDVYAQEFLHAGERWVEAL